MILKTLKEFIKIIWIMGRGFINLIYGTFQLSKLPGAPVSVLGGSKLTTEGKHVEYVQEAHEFIHRLINAEISVISTGCPGVMKIKNCGNKNKKKSMMTDLILTTPDPSKKSCCIVNNITIYRFFARKWILLNYSAGFVVFPGGFGTMSELTQVLTLMQTKIRKKSPIILYSTQYWNPFMVWLNDSALKNGLISASEAQLFTMTDDLEYAYEVMVKSCVEQINIFAR